MSFEPVTGAIWLPFERCRRMTAFGRRCYAAPPVMLDEYGPTLAVDVATVLVCTALLIRFADLRFSHPATPYIVFHLHTVTTRLAGLMNGANALYANSEVYFQEVVPAEIIRAAQYCDFAFCAVTLVWIIFGMRTRSEPPPPTNPVMLDPALLRPILLVAFVGGIVGLRVAAQIPGVSVYDGFNPESDWSTSSYLMILPTWFGLAVLGYAYYWGFGKVTVLLTAVYLVIMSLQGGLRFRVIIALLLAVQIVIERKGARWPSRLLLVSLAAAAALFFPMKQLGVLIQRGEDFESLSKSFSDSTENASGGRAGDQMFLDEFACALTQLDLNGKLYLGDIYLPLLTLPIPRALWPNKPTLSDFVRDISTKTRPMYTSGMITTYLGEAYANFGVAGIFIVPPVLAFMLAMFHRRARGSPYHSVTRFSYVLVSVNLVQVYRDGLQSIFVFVFVNMMPLMVVAVAHVLRSFVYRPTGGAPTAASADRFVPEGAVAVARHEGAEPSQT